MINYIIGESETALKTSMHGYKPCIFRIVSLIYLTLLSLSFVPCQVALQISISQGWERYNKAVVMRY